MKYNSALVWLRRDLRLNDHAVLKKACDNASQVFVAFVFDRSILEKLNNKSDKRVSFIFDCVQELKLALRAKGGDLILLFGNPVTEIPKMAALLGVQAVFVGRDYDNYSKYRDGKVQIELKKTSVEFLSVKDHVIFENSEIRNGAGATYKVYTPYKRAWLKRLRRSDYLEQKPDFTKLKLGPGLSQSVNKFSSVKKISDIGFEYERCLFRPGEKFGRRHLNKFGKTIEKYGRDRDLLMLAATSGLGIHFRFGTVSIRQAVRLALTHRSGGSLIWLSELIWRDFYNAILDAYPHVERESFREKYKDIKWTGEKRYLEAWKAGVTGVPIVDAAMRNFADTGWMHNRLRMIVASFLVKDLLTDWRLGEKYFAEFLLDFDVASNNGGWQWSASTGCDAQPYFRIFNPYSQSVRFDPTGEFIRRHCPELRGFSSKHIHAPHMAPVKIQRDANCIVGQNYPVPIVEHRVQREKALKLFER